MVWAWHGKCESDTTALCKSNGKDTFYTLSGKAWARHGNGMLCVNRPLRATNINTMEEVEERVEILVQYKQTFVLLITFRNSIL